MDTCRQILVYRGDLFGSRAGHHRGAIGGVPCVQAKLDSKPMVPFKVVDQRPIHESAYVVSIIHGTDNLQSCLSVMLSQSLARQS